MLHIAIADDDAATRDAIGRLVSDFLAARAADFALHCFSSGSALLDSGQRFDLAFLDIRMGGMTGMEAAHRMRAAGSDCVLVFVTALADYVYEAFSVEAADFLLKPLDPQRFAQVMGRVYPRLTGASQPALLLPSRGRGCLSIPFSQLLYAEALNHRLILRTADGEQSCRLRLAELADKLDSRFFQCHRSYLVNLEHVRGYAEGMALLDNRQRIPVSRLRGQAFSQAMLAYLKEARR